MRGSPLQIARGALWFAARPALWPEIPFLVRRALTARAPTAFSECASVAVSPDAALERVGVSQPLVDPRALYPAEFSEADARCAQCPVRMGGPANLSIVYSICEAIGATRVIETGVAYGWSSLALLLSVSRRGGRLISIDRPYPGTDSKRYAGVAVPQRLRENWRLINATDRIGLPKALDDMPEVDLCHYDSDKHYDGRMYAYPRLWRALSRGGIFISDDIGDDRAFLDFARSINREPIVARSGDKFVGILRKESGN